MTETDKKGVAGLAFTLLVRLVVKLYGRKNLEIIFCAKDKVEVLGADPIEGPLPSAAIGHAVNAHDVSHTDFAEYPILSTDCLLEPP